MNDKQYWAELNLYTDALNLEYPWFVVDRQFDKINGRLDIYLTFDRRATFTCAACGAPHQPFHDVNLKDRVWRHLDFFEYEAYLHAPLPRVTCGYCGKVKAAHIPWARPGRGLTQKFELLILELVKCMPVLNVAKQVRLHDTRIWRVVHDYVDKALEKMDLSDLKRVAIDETSAKKGHNYISLVVDLDVGKVVFVTEGKDAGTLRQFKKHLEEKKGNAQQITTFCSDLSPAFIQGVKEEFPRAAHVFDKFHVIEMDKKRSLRIP
jgi:transposase